MRRLICLTTLAILACGSPSGPEPEALQVAAAVQIVEGDGQDVEAGEISDPITAMVLDSMDNPAEGQIVSFEVNGGSEEECGFWESSSLSSNTSGEVSNTLHVGQMAYTNRERPACRYRIIHSSDGSPAPLVDSLDVRVVPGPPVAFSPAGGAVMREDGTQLRGEPADDARAVLARLWRDRHGNPSPYDAAVTSGGATVDECCDPGETWFRAIVADTTFEGDGTFEAWTVPDSTMTLTGEFRVWSYGTGGSETWICAVYGGGFTLADCDGPPES